MRRRVLPPEVWVLLRQPMVLIAAVVAMGCGLLGPLAVKWLLDEAIPAQGWAMLYALAAVVALAIAIAAASRALSGLVAARVATGLATKVGEAALTGLAETSGVSVAFGAGAPAGTLLAAALEAWGSVASTLLFGAAALGGAVAALLVVGFDSAGLLALACVAVAGAVLVAVSRGQREAIREIQERGIGAQATSAGEVADLVGALATLKTMPTGSHDLGQGSFARANRLALLSAEVSARWNALRAAIKTTAGLGALLILWILGGRGPGGLAAGAGAAWAALAALDGLLDAQVALEAYWPVRALLEVLVDAPRAWKGGGLDPGPLRSLEVRDLWFRYGPDTPWVLEGVNLLIQQGSLIRLQWPSGAGKSTLLRILAGVLTPDRGEVLVNGVPIQQLDLLAFRRRLGVLPQEQGFLSGTIFEALRPALLEQELEAEAWELLDRVGAGELVRSLPLGLHTRLVQGGAALSGGECRRLALARALHSRAELMLLDEPLAGLGETSEWLMKVVTTCGAMALIIDHESDME